MIDPCINPKTQKPFAWENPEFTPGVHCTSCRYAVLTTPRNPDFRYTCEKCIVDKKLYQWRKRSQSAKLAALKRKASKRR